MTMAIQDRRPKPIELPSEEHLLLDVVIDISGSMSDTAGNGKTKLDLVNEGITRMITELKNDHRLAKMVDLEIITFESQGAHKIYQGVAPLDQIPLPICIPPSNGSTYAVNALNLAIEEVRSRVALYEHGFFVPWLVFVTDGEIFDDLTAIGSILKEREAKNKIRVFCLGTDDFQPAQLHKLVDVPGRVYKLNNYDFDGFFAYLGKSIGVRSSVVSSQGVPLPDPAINPNTGQKPMTVV